MPLITLSIDNQNVTVQEGSTILEAARQAGIRIPTLCYLKELTPASACRVCVVEVEGFRTLVASCSYPVSAGLKVTTTSERVLRARRQVVEMLLSDHPSDCMTCEKAGDCKLERLAYEFSLTRTRFAGERHNYPVDTGNPFIQRDYNKCVLSTARRLYHYHTRTQTGRAAGLNDLLGEETADLSPDDAEAIGIADGEKIRVKSRRGEVVVKARLTDQVPRGMVWMAFHFREACANWLTNPVFDPVSQTAEYKACAVNIEKLQEFLL
jgi:predicted molibdopterin-dependent oxidoreductase YjgC